MTEPPDINDLLKSAIDRAVRHQYAVLEARLLRVFGTAENARRELRDSPLTLYQTPEGNLRGDLPSLRMAYTCRRCGVEQSGPAIWTPEELRDSKALYGKWQCCVCRYERG